MLWYFFCGVSQQASSCFFPDGYGSVCIHIPPIVHCASELLSWDNIGSGEDITLIFYVIAIIGSNQRLLFIIQIIRNLTYEEQKYLYQQLGEIFRERQLMQSWELICLWSIMWCVFKPFAHSVALESCIGGWLQCTII
jgi:hypothetical protein